MRSLRLVVTSLFLFACSTPTDTGGHRDAGSTPGDAEPTLDGARDPDAAIDVDATSDPDAGPLVCPPPSACDAPAPDPGPEGDWRHSVATTITTAMGGAQHRGRDLFLRASDPQWALAKFTYGLADDDLKDEDVDIWLLRDCGTAWELLGTATTTHDGDHETVEGVEDTGGRVYFQIPDAQRLGIGRHRLHFVVRGDHTTAEQIIEVVPDDARFVVSDMDGTLTTSETVAFTALLTGDPPDVNASAPELLWAYANRGYHIFYLTARPEWLTTTSQEWVALRGLPPGVVHTTLLFTPGLGAEAQTFKEEELGALLARFPDALDYAIGNTDTDMGAFAAVGLPPEHIYSYQFDPGALGTRVDDYGTLVPDADALPLVCD